MAILEEMVVMSIEKVLYIGVAVLVIVYFVAFLSSSANFSADDAGSNKIDVDRISDTFLW